jgi:hypothetical protein
MPKTLDQSLREFVFQLRRAHTGALPFVIFCKGGTQPLTHPVLGESHYFALNHFAILFSHK